MTKSNSFVKNLKIINNSINSLLERNLNKLKLKNLKNLVSNNKIILSFVALFVLFISYLLAPTFYKQTYIYKELKSELLTKFNLNFTFTQKLNYNFFPRPHFISNESFITQNQKKISEINKIKIYVSLENLFSIKNVNINEVIIEDANFQLNNENSNFFIKLLENSFFVSTLKIKNSNIFFRNLENEVLFINKIKNMKYYYDPKDLKNILYSENEIFNTPYSLEVINNKDKKKLYTKLNLNLLKLQIENVYNYESNIKLGSAVLSYDKNKSILNYKANKNYFEFDYYDELEEPKFFYNGKLNFKPFHSTFEGTAEEINVSYFFGSNAIIPELFKTGIFNSKNLDFELYINANKIKNNKNFTNFFLKSKIHDGLIDIDDTKIEWKNSTIAKLTDTLLYVKDGKLVLDGRSQIDITNSKNIYQFLLTPKNFRKKIKKIDLSFSYIFDEKLIILKDILIDGKFNKKVNVRINNIYLRDDDLQNKIYFKNLMNDAIKAYAG